MPFGLKNAPATFQRYMQVVLHDFLYKGVDVYLDDIVVYTETEEEHVSLLRQVIDKLEAVGFRLKRSKCKFFEPSISYLGHVISSGQVRPTNDNIKAIIDFPRPTNVQGVQSFVGKANYYRDFVENMSRIIAPLTRLTRKNVDFVWTDEQERAFNDVKRILTTEPVIAIFDPSLPTELTTDASKLGLAGILTQKHEDGKSHVISYWSRKTNDAESRYSAVELECLAVLEALEHYRVYVEGTTITIIPFESPTDLRNGHFLLMEGIDLALFELIQIS